MTPLRRDQGGFTLVELGLVLIVMGILAAAAIPMVTTAHQNYMHQQDRQILEAARNAIIGYASSAWGLPCFNDSGTSVATGCDVEVTLGRLGVRARDSRNKPLVYSPSWMLTQGAVAAAAAKAKEAVSSVTHSKEFFCGTATRSYQGVDVASLATSTFGTTAVLTATTVVFPTLVTDPDAYNLAQTAPKPSVRAVPAVCLDYPADLPPARTVGTFGYCFDTVPPALPSVITTPIRAAAQAFVLAAKGDDGVENLEQDDSADGSGNPLVSNPRVFENPARPPDLRSDSATGYYDDIVLGISPAEFKTKVCQ